MRYLALVTCMVFLGCKDITERHRRPDETVNHDSIKNSNSLLQDSAMIAFLSIDSLKADPAVPRVNNKIKVNELSLRLNDSCSAANAIRNVLIEFLHDETIGSDAVKLIDILSLNSHVNDIDCYFPRNNEELLLLYEFTERMEDTSRQDSEGIRIILQLYKHMGKAVEYSEHLHSVIPNIAVQNTLGFVKEIARLNSEDRAVVLENLEYLPNLTKVEQLRKNLSSIEDKELRTTVEEIQLAINKIFEN